MEIEKEVESELLNSAVEYVAAQFYLSKPGLKRESIETHAKMRLTKSTELLQENGFIPHLSHNAPPQIDSAPSDFPSVLGSVDDVLIPHGVRNISIRVKREAALALCKQIYLISL